MQHKIIFLRNNTPSYTAKPVHGTLKALSWEVLLRVAYLPDLTPSNYHLSTSVGYAFAQQRFGSYEDVKKCLDEWFPVKWNEFYYRGV